ncbi:peptide-methionine (R)-S-oxide reductase MsrB [Arthrobacter sp. ATA002]|uniref:peptide-methionine (R)-S-oxide reductase MsrB n=1 Tax=Arthrobacter sp. ATA002 TaxID=2991715 RepID=UPI0022A7B17B|nr:peptide-methionine (R)-S-oxide reductase MsrB [Arthrobacter sp. ATA002]WAP50817.1 peptide-methionine (R)-S-oxide reductase MsrB [Arthrobacter sp. ATA002]
MTEDTTGTVPVQKTDDQWREELTPQEYQVLRKAGTERPYTGEYWDTKTAGVYQCRACGSDLFTSGEKFDSHCGWPSFFAPLAEGRVRYLHDRSMGMDRIEVRCANCDSHMGHLFEGEGFDTPTDQRFCINSISVKLVPADAGAAGSGTQSAGGK